MTLPNGVRVVSVKFNPVGRAQTFIANDLPADVTPRSGDAIVVQCDSGALVWLTAVPDETTADSQVLRRDTSGATWTNVSAASDRGVLVSLVVGEGGDSPGAADHPAFHGVRLHLNDVRLRGTASTAGDKATRFAITSAISPLLESASVGTLVPVSLSLVASEPGRVTIYPPEFEFDP